MANMNSLNVVGQYDIPIEKLSAGVVKCLLNYDFTVWKTTYSDHIALEVSHPDIGRITTLILHSENEKVELGILPIPFPTDLEIVESSFQTALDLLKSNHSEDSEEYKQGRLGFAKLRAENLQKITPEYKRLFGKDPNDRVLATSNIDYIWRSQRIEHYTAVRQILLQYLNKFFSSEESESNERKSLGEINREKSESIGEQGVSAKPDKPTKPPQDSNVYVWLDWYHAMQKAGQKMTFPMLGKESGYSKNTFKQIHAQYKLDRGINLPKD